MDAVPEKGSRTDSPPAAIAACLRARYSFIFELPVTALATPRATSESPTMTTILPVLRGIVLGLAAGAAQWQWRGFEGRGRASYGPTMRRTGTSAREDRRRVRLAPGADAGSDVGSDVVVEDWGCVGYEEALGRQLALHARRVAGEAPDTLVVVSHPATFTLGRQAPETDIMLDRAELARRGIVVARSDRGGRATYHGPGQVVLYPIVSVTDLGLGVKDWVCLLESALIDTLADYGVSGHRRPATAGIWTNGDGVEGKGAEIGSQSGSKIASLGLRVARGVSYHGIALNTGLDASVFDCIVTCGVRGERVTTIAAITGVRPDDGEVAMRLARHVARRIREARGPAAGADTRTRAGEPRDATPNDRS